MAPAQVFAKLEGSRVTSDLAAVDIRSDQGTDRDIHWYARPLPAGA